MQIEGGKALLETLRNVGFDVIVGGWTKSTDEGDWYLYIASKDVDERGIAEAYGTIYTTIRANPELFIDPFEVKLIGRQHPITKDLLDTQGIRVAPNVLRSRRPKLGNMYVDDTYVYAM